MEEQKKIQSEYQNSMRELELLLLEKDEEIAELRDELEHNESFMEKVKI